MTRKDAVALYRAMLLDRSPVPALDVKAMAAMFATVFSDGQWLPRPSRAPRRDR